MIRTEREMLEVRCCGPENCGIKGSSQIVDARRYCNGRRCSAWREVGGGVSENRLRSALHRVGLSLDEAQAKTDSELRRLPGVGDRILDTIRHAAATDAPRGYCGLAGKP